ncbi:hypothetical protein DDZ13_09185 [Coraliomargarita sinensis]|uniref:ABC-type transport auxiliary lipoprotein component domain-containing protein n=1 Tax=Coraliomargarita sinensis TaxID=2174842 RepID=A0A317ZEL9_9BACT|nr:PqiC family protein [Coraliomargarita sinensis]PXA03806.1 hypothetical protein DDZ13_09185 [Coraliomargarita sinensis]
MHKAAFIFTVSLCLFGFWGCVNLKPVPSQSESFTLGPVGMTLDVPNLKSGEVIYIMRPQVPTYLDDKRLSYRSASGEVESMTGSRWAEPLAEGIARAMSMYFSGSDIGTIIGYYPWPNTSTEASRLSLYFQSFGATDLGDVHVVVRWSLKRTNENTVSGQFVSESLEWTVGEPETLIGAYNEALQQLALDIEKALRSE